MHAVMQTPVRMLAAAAAVLMAGGCREVLGSLIEGYVERRIEEGIPASELPDFPELPGGRTADEGLDFGAEIADATVEIERPFRFEYTASNDATHLLWLDYELGFVNGRIIEDEFTDHEWWRVEGPFGVEGGPQWTLQHTGERTPVVEHPFSVVYGSRRNSINGTGIASATEFLAVLPAAPVGTTVVITGTWHAQAGTTPNRLRLVVTD